MKNSSDYKTPARWGEEFMKLGGRFRFPPVMLVILEGSIKWGRTRSRTDKILGLAVSGAIS